jgi:exopolysaccharide biosynthesis polyprenyl glycosylphosphotransferase
MFKEYHRYKIFLMAMDAAITMLVLLALVELRPMLPGRPISPEEVMPYPAAYLLAGLLWHALFASMGVYENDIIPDFAKQIGRFTYAHLYAVLACGGILYLTIREASRMLFLYFSVTDYIALFLLRYFLNVYLKNRKKFFGGTHILIVGTCGSAVQLAESILKEHASVVKLIGFAEDEGCALDLPAPILGGINETPSIVKNHDVDLVMIALRERSADDVEKLITALESLPVRVYFVPDMLRLALVHAQVETFGELVAIGIREPVIRGHRRVFKRIMDLGISSLGLLIIWPVMAIIWIAVKLDSPGPAIYVARRVGANGKLFNMYKFRTMLVGAEQKQNEVVAHDEKNRAVYKIKGDPRVTRLGRILRRWSLDELPQLFNVLKGEMSLVGPRPEQPFLTEGYGHLQWRRVSAPPGITGLWQVSGRSDLAMHLNAQYDIYYVKNYSIMLDLKILLKTIGVVIKGKGAY